MARPKIALIRSQIQNWPDKTLDLYIGNFQRDKLKVEPECDVHDYICVVLGLMKHDKKRRIKLAVELEQAAAKL